MNPALDALCGPNGALHLEPPDRSEYKGLGHSGEARLADARRPENSIESRFDLAYNAADALSLAALRRLGYRPAKRYIVFQALEHTLGLRREEWRVLDRAHSLRNRGEYEGDLHVDERFLAEVVAVTSLVFARLKELAAAEGM